MIDSEKIFACLLLIIMFSTCNAFYPRFIFSKYQSRSGLDTLKMQEDRQLSYNAEVVEIRQVQGLIDGLKMRKLPHSDLVVSEVGLGTMPFGRQVTRKTAFEILDMATKVYGINFLDTAELYPFPFAESTQGNADRFLGAWLSQHSKSMRDSLVISGSICGYDEEINWVRNNRNEGTQLTKKQIHEAVDKMLDRLQIDYLDILQLHWPERYIPRPGLYYDLFKERINTVSIFDQLEAINELIKAGKIRNYGISNETPYGATAFASMAQGMGIQRPSTIQMPLNLIERQYFEQNLLETCSPLNANLGVIAHTPLAGGALTGKYHQDIENIQNDWRLKQFTSFQIQYITPLTKKIIEKYLALAKKMDCPLTILALGWVMSRPYVSSTVIGVTNTNQLQENMKGLNMDIFDSPVDDEIDDIYLHNPWNINSLSVLPDPFTKTVDPSYLPWVGKDTKIPELMDIVIDKKNDQDILREQIRRFEDFLEQPKIVVDPYEYFEQVGKHIGTESPSSGETTNENQ